LRSASKAVRQAVLRRGSLAGSRNPSAVLLYRIRGAEQELRAEPRASAADGVEQFLASADVLPHAAELLRKSPRQVQDAVMARGALSGSRNATAVLWARIRDAGGAPGVQPNLTSDAGASSTKTGWTKPLSPEKMQRPCSWPPMAVAPVVGSWPHAGHGLVPSACAWPPPHPYGCYPPPWSFHPPAGPPLGPGFFPHWQAPPPCATWFCAYGAPRRP